MAAEISILLGCAGHRETVGEGLLSLDKKILSARRRIRENFYAAYMNSFPSEEGKLF